MNRINDKQLREVAGGESRERTLYLNIELPEGVGDLIVKVYFDGLLHDTMTIDTNYKTSFRLGFSESCGKHMVNVKINDMLYKEYVLDFDKATIVP